MKSQRHRCPFIQTTLAALAGCLFLTSTSVTQDVEAVAKYPTKRIMTVLGRADSADVLTAFDAHWERESHRIQSLGGLTDEELATITKMVQPHFKPLAEKTAEEDTNKYYDYTYGLFAMRRELDQVLKPTLQQSLGADRYEVYKKDLEQRRQMRKSWIVGSMLSTINGSVALDSEQLAKLRVEMNDRFDLNWALTALNYRPYDKMDPKLGAFVEQLLTPEQHLAWDAAAKYLAGGFPVRSTDEVKQMKIFRDDLRVCVDAHIHTLNRTLGLDEAQLRKLRILAKGIEGELIQRRSKARQQYSDPTVKVVTPATSSDARDAPGTMLVAHPRWQAHVVNVLNDDQKKKFLESQRARRERHVERLAGTMVRRLSSDIGLTAEQTREFVATVHASFPEDTSEPSIHGRLGIAIGPIPQNDIAKILGPKNSWAWRGVYRGFLRDVRPNKDD